MRFLQPDLARWWLVLPVLAACWFLYYRHMRGVRRQAAMAPRFAQLSRRSTWLRYVTVLTAGLTAGGSLVFALARPQVVLTRRTPEFERQDLIVMLDQSASMRAQDIVPSRSARATRELRNLLQHKPEDIERVGLVGFADAALVLSYLTRDVGAISFYLDWIDGESEPLFGTNIGAALKSAMEIAKKDNRPTRKLFVILSDGEDRGAELEQALATFRAEGYRVHCIGIGSDDVVPIPLVEANGEKTFLRDDDGQLVRTLFQEATLREIASTTGGRYFRSTTGGELADAMADLMKRERKLRGWNVSTEYRDLYPAALAAAGLAGAALWWLW